MRLIDWLITWIKPCTKKETRIIKKKTEVITTLTFSNTRKNKMKWESKTYRLDTGKV